MSRGTEQKYDISHEALIRNWPLFQEWLRTPAEVAYALSRVLIEIEPEKFEAASADDKNKLIPEDLARRVETVARGGTLPTGWGEDQIAPYLLRPALRRVWGDDKAAALHRMTSLAYMADEKRKEVQKAKEAERRRQEISMLGLSMAYAAFHHLAGITLLHEYIYRQNEKVGDLFQRGFFFLRDYGFIEPATLEFDKKVDGTNMVGKARPTQIGLLYVKVHNKEVPMDWLTDPKKRSNLNIDVAINLGCQLTSNMAFHHLAGITLLHENIYRQNEKVGDLFQRGFSFLRDYGFIEPATLEFDKKLDGTNMVGEARPAQIGLLYVKLHKDDIPIDWLDPKTKSNLNSDVARELGFQLANDGAFRSARRRVLWVDDQPQNNENEINALISQSIEVVTRKSTREALEEIKKQGFDVIITDQLRYEDGIRKDEAGYELIRALRDNRIKAPVILTTSPDNDDAHRRGFFAVINTQLGVFEHVLKALQ